MVPFAVMAAAMMMLPIALDISFPYRLWPMSLHGTGGFSPTETKGDLGMS
jgi:hypothetical protein